MRDLTEWRATSAVARYHILTVLRAANGPFWTTLIVSALGLLRSPIVIPQSVLLSWGPRAVLYESAQTVSAVCLLHLAMVFTATAMVVAPRRQLEGRVVADLMETAPISPLGRFTGDMIGAAACALVIHACTVPVVALAFVLSPVSSAMFWWYELIVIAVVILMAAGVAWKKRLAGVRGRARATAQIALTLLLALLIVGSTTRRPYFGEAVASFISEPSYRRWSNVVAEVMNPPLFVALFALLYFGSIFYFAARSRRLLMRAEEGLT